jgi:RNA polymerase sigma factor (sigma-70 family)
MNRKEFDNLFLTYYDRLIKKFGEETVHNLYESFTRHNRYENLESGNSYSYSFFCQSAYRTYLYQNNLDKNNPNYLQKRALNLYPTDIETLELDTGDDFSSVSQVGDLIEKVLTPDEKELVYYYYWDGYNGQEIAQIKGVSKATISRHLSKTLNKLKEELNNG